MSNDDQFPVDTRPTKTVVVDSLTKDATILECVLDLIDNSIDAAREAAYAELTEDEQKLLLEDYSDFKIDLTLNGSEFCISDNCHGVDPSALAKSVLRFGERSFHEMGIGLYGVGLNRALFKLGRYSELTTDTGTERSHLVLDVEAYLASDDWNLVADRRVSTKKRGTILHITQLPTDVSQTFADAEWLDALRLQLSRRYGRFIAKGLRLKVNTVEIPGKTVEIRENSPFQCLYKTYRTAEGVSVHVTCGQHIHHRFNGEKGYDETSNRALTSEFGWTVLCNDRAILMSDTTSATGWIGKFHSEFYGFVGIVSFVASDPAKLPWNTKKTGVDLNNPAYQAALSDMRKFAEAWRSFAARRKKAKSQGNPFQALPLASSPPVAKPTPTPLPASPAPAPKSPPAKKVDHNATRMILTEDIDEGRVSNDKLLALIHEAKLLDMGTLPYSGLAVIRMLFESSVFQFFVRRGESKQLHQFAVDSRRKADPSRTIDEKKVVASMDEMIDYLDQHPDVWGTGKETMLKHSLSRMKVHKPRLNSAIHNPYQAIDRNDAFNIRTEILPILRYLIET